MILAVHFVGIFFDLDPMKSFGLQQVAKEAAAKLGALIEGNVKIINSAGFLTGISDKIHPTQTPLKGYGVHVIKQLLDAGLTPYEVAWSQMMPTAGAMVANQAQVVSLQPRMAHS